MRITLRRAIAFGAAALLLAVLIVWAGVFRIAASSGHWAITDWLLHYAMRQSVSTYSLGIKAPPLDDPALVHRGAGHFANGCAPCHGAPGDPPSVVTQEMTPHPPRLAGRIDEWEPAELFWIVMHGVKFTGMPAWPAQGRDDEVWSLVAFLLELPELEPEAYRRLAFGEAATVPEVDAVAGLGADPVRQCVRCHGRDGTGRGNGAFPILAGQSEAYLGASLQAYAAGTRHSGIMQPMSRPLGEAEIDRLARHYATATPSEPAEPSPPVEKEAVRRGEAIFTEGVPNEGIPPCASCHAPEGGRRYPIYPLLAGQHAGYVVDQLQAFRKGVRGGTPFAHIMATVAERMTDRQMRAVAAYLTSLAPEEGGLRRR